MWCNNDVVVFEEKVFFKDGFVVAGFFEAFSNELFFFFDKAFFFKNVKAYSFEYFFLKAEKECFCFHKASACSVDEDASFFDAKNVFGVDQMVCFFGVGCMKGYNV